MTFMLMVLDISKIFFKIMCVLSYCRGFIGEQVLVGESLVKQEDPCAGISKLFGEDISRRKASLA